MTFHTHCKIAQGRIDPAPMVDVVFLLLIFIVLSSPFVLQPGFRAMELPISNNPQGATFQGLTVMVSRDNLIFFNDQQTTLDGLRAQLGKAATESRNPELIIKADRHVPYETIVKILNIASDVSVSVNLATRPEVPSGAMGR